MYVLFIYIYFTNVWQLLRPVPRCCGNDGQESRLSAKGFPISVLAEKEERGARVGALLRPRAPSPTAAFRPPSLWLPWRAGGGGGGCYTRQSRAAPRPTELESARKQDFQCSWKGCLSLDRDQRPNPQLCIFSGKVCRLKSLRWTLLVLNPMLQWTELRRPRIHSCIQLIL